MVTTAKYRKLEMKYKKEKSTAKRIHFFLKFNFLDTLRNPVPPYPLLFRFNFIFILFFYRCFLFLFFMSNFTRAAHSSHFKSIRNRKKWFFMSLGISKDDPK